MYRSRHVAVIALLVSYLVPAAAQEYGVPDRGQPGDEMIQAYLAREADRIHATFLAEVKSLEDWQTRRAEYRHQYFHMLGLDPLPEKTPLQATVTGTVQRDGYAVDMIHYQSRPGLYVTGNLYRPDKIQDGERLPAVFYVCGHSGQGRNGNKTAYQSHGIWFAKHGYICLTVDSLQLGEIAAIHHGTYREGRWWWHSRGYTPAGVECWNGVRGIDYLTSRPDVDPDRIAVTGISGGGAATFWIAAADERVAVAVPVSGMADLPSYVNNRVINGHCDCMFLYNTYQWPWTRIAALIAPRPMLFTNSDADRIFPMDANDRIINRLERVYSLYGRTDFVDAVVSIGGHAYRQDIRQAAYRFINTQLKNDPRVVEDSEADLVAGDRPDREYPIPIEQLRVFPEDTDLPADERNTTIDEHFVPLADVPLPEPNQFERWRTTLQEQLREITFRSLPADIPAATLIETAAEPRRLATEPGIEIALRQVHVFKPSTETTRVVLHVQSLNAQTPITGFMHDVQQSGDVTFVCDPRGTGGTKWTTKDPPNYVERSHLLLGRTVDTGRVWDIIATAKYLRANYPAEVPVCLAGEGAAGVLGVYAALWCPEIDSLDLGQPPASHREPDAPQFLNVLRVCDIPDAVGMLAPRNVILRTSRPDAWERALRIYQAAGADAGMEIQKTE